MTCIYVCVVYIGDIYIIVAIHFNWIITVMQITVFKGWERMETNYFRALILLIVAFICLSTTTGESLYHTFWVTPSTEQGCGNRTPCDTIDGYGQNKSIFSTSNTTWMLLKGSHRTRLDITISLAANITFKGFGRAACTLQVIGRIIVNDSSNFSIANVTLMAADLRIENVSRLTLSNSTIRRIDLVLPIIRIFLTNPTGIYKIKDCKIGEAIVIIDNHENFNTTDGYNSSIIIEGTEIALETGISYFLRPTKKLKDVSIVIRGSIMSGMTFLITGYPQERFSLSVIDSQILWDFNLTFHVFNAPSVHSVEVAIQRCLFSNPNSARYPEGILFSVTFREGYTIQSVDYALPFYPTPNIEITDTEFDGTVSQVRNVVPVAVHESTASYFTFQNCTFHRYEGLRKPRFQGYHIPISSHVLVLKELWFPILLWNCKIINNIAGAISMSNSKLQIRGHNLIINNERWAWTNAIEILTFNGLIEMICSKILLENDSQLLISHNYGLQYFGSIVTPPTLEISRYSYHAEKQYKQCHKGQELTTHSDGSCFFQLVDQQGHFLKLAGVTNFNGKIVFSNNRYELALKVGASATGEIYNGHLFNCILQTQGSYITTNLTLLKQFIYPPSWTSKYVPTPPYYICLCDGHGNLKNSSLWDCKENTNMAVLPEEKDLTFYVSVVGDLGDISNSSLVELDCEGDLSCISQLLIRKECTRTIVSNVPIQVNKTAIILRLKWPFSFYQDLPITYYSIHKVNILRCPIGFKEDLIVMKCECRAFLIQHHFECHTTKNEGFYYIQVKYDNLWLGFQQGSLVICDYCPSVFCNEVLRTEGVTLEDSNASPTNKQCNEENGRIGFVCSECPPGYSSVFGGYTCTQCNGPWFILIIPLYALAGLALIALLFLFNLTIMQGTINGISLFANVIYLYDDKLQGYAGKPFYNIISLLNFGSGFETCFYDGMDEFVKAVLQFAFPFYLISLVILIVIGAHKFNLRVFRIEFIAKRAVPVLATLMVLTYTNLIGLVINALRYSKIIEHNAWTGEERMYIVWLYQPNIEYFQGRHLFLGVLAIAVTVLYLIPLTAITLFGDPLRRMCIRSLWFSHFLDVFHGAYRWPLGFWLGVRLLLRAIFVVLLFVLQFQIFNFIVILSLCVFFYLQWLIVKPFHKRFQPIINTQQEKFGLFSNWIACHVNPMKNDGFFLLVMVFFSAVNFNANTTVNVIASILSISLATLQIIIIAAYHGWKYFPIPECARERWTQVKEFVQKKRVATDQEGVPKVDPDIERFPFLDLHQLVAGVPQEGESNETETPLSQREDEPKSEGQDEDTLTRPLLTRED